MRRYPYFVVTLGALTLGPGLVWAGPFSFGEKTEAGGQKAAAPKTTANQQTVESIGRALKSKALTRGFQVDIRFENGVATLEGHVVSAPEKLAATKAALTVPGVKRVDNRLEVRAPQAAPANPVQPAVARSVQGQGPIRRVNMQAEEAMEEAEAPMSAPVAPLPAVAPGLTGAMPSAPPPAAYPPVATPAPVIYDQPNYPDYAWPAYAQYPNYANVTYPSKYSASAWPYIGPFYPYPQVPLGWRKAQLEWDDGYWQLNFRPRTERWWWFLDYRNW